MDVRLNKYNMKLKKYEIDAITEKVINTVKQNLKLPDFKKELSEEKIILDKISNLREKITKLNDEISELRNKAIIKYNTDFNEKVVLNTLTADFYRKNVPPDSEIQNAVILSNNKDLNALVEELIKKYSK
jgi:hypothetical protein